jgi:hypothetical protein
MPRRVTPCASGSSAGAVTILLERRKVLKPGTARRTSSSVSAAELWISCCVRTVTSAVESAVGSWSRVAETTTGAIVKVCAGGGAVEVAGAAQPANGTKAIAKSAIVSGTTPCDRQLAKVPK